MAKAKLIKSGGATPRETQGKWHDLKEDTKRFTQGIEAGTLDKDQLSNILSSTLISGIPTPWARAKIFWFAMDCLQASDSNMPQSGLIEFYKTLIDEWKGLIAVAALFQERVRFSAPIYMNPEEDDLFEISGAFGRMLLDDTVLWTDQVQNPADPNAGKPYIQLLYYHEQLIGGTSPFSIIFPAVEYGNLERASDIPWYNGKFGNPMDFLKSDNDKLQKLYLFIKNVNDNVEKYADNINICRSNNKLDLDGLKTFLDDWQKEIKEKGNKLRENGISAKYPELSEPYRSLLYSQQKVYQLTTGGFTFDKPADANLIKAELSDLQNILKEDKKIIGWFESTDYQQPLSNAAVYYLQVNDVRNNQKKYFALPLSMEAIQMFGQQIDNLVSSNKNQNLSIAASIREGSNLVVDLSVDIGGQQYKLNPKEYEIVWAEDTNPGGKVIMWPNFISDNWKAYYLYTDFPIHNSQGILMFPFYKRGSDQQIITANLNDGDQVVYSSGNDPEAYEQANLEITELVKYPANISNMPQYEVIKSNCAVAGLEVRIVNAGKSEIAGYLIVRNPNTPFGNRQIKDLTTESKIDDAIVGIDFGSNNSCVRYTLSQNQSKAIGIKFTNRRLALVGIDDSSGATAQQDELLFFSNESTISGESTVSGEPIYSGQVKSWLHEHDRRYITNNEDKEIAGGVAVNKKNILVREMDKIKITTQAGILHYNMKWLNSEEGIRKKTAYLKALWLSVCADLYYDHYHPVELRWSYPGSMSHSDWTVYNFIYSNDLRFLTPIFEKKRQLQLTVSSQTEAEAVCKYALSQLESLDQESLFLGIDIGGSTSDILLLADYKKPVELVKQDQNEQAETEIVRKLYKQSSVRLAAGVFFEAVIKSETFRKAIYRYHESHQTGQNKIKVENIQEIVSEGNKAPFYLNSVFDQLTGDRFGSFYSFIVKEASFVYAIPAYVTGLLIYYAGKLSAATIKENNLTEINQVHIFPFGKGGRLFHWLKSEQSYIEGSEDYFKNCFHAGFGDGANNIKVIYEDISKDNKSEVAIGLSVNKPLEPSDPVGKKKTREESDIFAEKNIQYWDGGQFKTLDECDVTKNSYFENISNFKFPERLENFEEFVRIFVDFIGRKTGLVKDYSSLESRLGELKGRLKSFIENDPEYDKARQAKAKQTKEPIPYRIPILIAEGLCYLEQILIPEIFKS